MRAAKLQITTIAAFAVLGRFRTAMAASGIFQSFKCPSDKIELSFIDYHDDTLGYWDKGSGAHMDGAFYNVKQSVLDGLDAYSFGSYGVNNYAAPGNLALAVVKKESKSIRASTGWALIWNDGGTGADMDGAAWRPTCPDGFVPLGLTWVPSHSKPSAPAACVERLCTDFANAGSLIWQDSGSGGHMDGAFWSLVPSRMPTPGYLSFTVNTMMGWSRYTAKPGTGAFPEMRVLMVTPTSTEVKSPFNPILKGPTRPPEFSAKDAQVDSVIVPFLAITDHFLTVSEQVLTTPFYTVKREQLYRLDDFQVNNAPSVITKTVSATTGVTSAKSSTFSTEVSVSVEAESGVSFLGSGGKVKATLATKLGFSSSRSLTILQEKQVTTTYTIPAKHAWALYSGFDKISVLRKDDTLVSHDLEFEADAWYVSTYDLSKVHSK